ncbi:MAG: RsmD family RNA methyltransferase, partial [Deltaproteobacteria bacterium]|nr:RsmD family RNA methyltransferase [Deltaproteobacteria bacterium]
MSSVRITGGVARGRVLREPIPSRVRPTSARVREALFSMLGQDQHGRRI